MLINTVSLKLKCFSREGINFGKNFHGKVEKKHLGFVERNFMKRQYFVWTS